MFSRDGTVVNDMWEPEDKLFIMCCFLTLLNWNTKELKSLLIISAQTELLLSDRKLQNSSPGSGYEHCSGVDTLAQGWRDENNWVCPPVLELSRLALVTALWSSLSGRRPIFGHFCMTALPASSPLLREYLSFLALKTSCWKQFRPEANLQGASRGLRRSPEFRNVSLTARYLVSLCHLCLQCRSFFCQFYSSGSYCWSFSLASLLYCYFLCHVVFCLIWQCHCVWSVIWPPLILPFARFAFIILTRILG